MDWMTAAGLSPSECGIECVGTSWGVLETDWSYLWLVWFYPRLGSELVCGTFLIWTEDGLDDCSGVDLGLSLSWYGIGEV